MAKQVLESLSGMKTRKISHHMHYFIEKMMAKDREIRYQSPQELIEDIEYTIEGQKSLQFDPENVKTNSFNFGFEDPQASKNSARKNTQVIAVSNTPADPSKKEGSNRGHQTKTRVATEKKGSDLLSSLQKLGSFPQKSASSEREDTKRRVSATKRRTRFGLTKERDNKESGSGQTDLLAGLQNLSPSSNSNSNSSKKTGAERGSSTRPSSNRRRRR